MNNRHRKRMRVQRQAYYAEPQAPPTAPPPQPNAQPNWQALETIMTAFLETQKSTKKPAPGSFWSRLRKNGNGTKEKDSETLDLTPPPPPPPPSINMEQEMVELYQSLRTLLANPGTILQFIGSVKGEGTSTIAREFARTAAVKFHRKALLFNADWQEPALDFNGDHESIEAIARNSLAVDRALRPVDEGSLFECRICSDNELSPDLYDLPAMSDVWTELRRRFDLVVIDSPPAMVSSDGLTISREVDGVVLVMRAETTRWPVAVAVKEKIVKNGGKIVGFAFNNRQFYIPRWIYRRL